MEESDIKEKGGFRIRDIFYGLVIFLFFLLTSWIFFVEIYNGRGGRLQYIIPGSLISIVITTIIMIIIKKDRKIEISTGEKRGLRAMDIFYGVTLSIISWAISGYLIFIIFGKSWGSELLGLVFGFPIAIVITTIFIVFLKKYRENEITD